MSKATRFDDPALRAFTETEGRLVFSHVAAASLTDVPSTNLTAWGRRGFAPAIKERARGVRYTGSSLLRIAVLAELAWALGPSRAAVIADGLRTSETYFFDAIRASLRDGTSTAFASETRRFLVIQRPDASGDAAFPVEGEENTPGALIWFLRDDAPDPEKWSRAHLTVPLGRVWALMAAKAGAWALARAEALPSP